MIRIYCLNCLLISFLALSCSTGKQDPECEKFHEGKFLIKSKNGIPGFLLIRNDVMQYETNLVTGDISVFNIDWLDQCEYELHYLYQKKKDSSLPAKKIIPDSVRVIPWRTRILKSGKDYYVFEAGKEGINKKLVDTIWVDN